MTDREADGNAHGMRGLLPIVGGVHRERRDRHQVIRAEPVEEPERQRIGRQNHTRILP